MDDRRTGPKTAKRGRLRWLLTAVLSMLLAAYFTVAWMFGWLLLAQGRMSPAQEAAYLESIGAASTPADVGLPEPEVFVVVHNGVRLVGWYFRNPAGGDCGVVLLHGRGGTRVGMLAYAPLFWRHGCDLALYDARVHGESGGEFITFGDHEAGEAVAVADWLAQRAGLERGQIGLFGVSYGATTALLAGAAAPDLAFVAADSAYSDLATLARERAEMAYGPLNAALFTPSALWISGLIARYDPFAVSAVEAVRQPGPPALLVHAGEDAYTRAGHSQRIYEAAGTGRAALYITDWGAGHAGSLGADPAGYQALVDAFLKDYVPGFGGR